MNKIIIPMIGLFLVALTGFVYGDTYDTHTLVKIYVPGVFEQQLIQEARLDVVRAGDSWLEALVTDDGFHFLRKNGLKYEILHDRMAQERASRAIPGWCSSQPWPCYYTASAFNTVNPPAGSLMAYLLGVHTSYPDITRLYDIGDSEDGAYDIIALKVASDPDTEGNRPKIRLYGNIHGDESLAMMVVCATLDWVLANYPTDPDALKLVDQAEIWFIPSGNPYGLNLKTRYNINGIDLNRNFWGPNGSDEPPAWSESETRAVRDLTEGFPAAIPVYPPGTPQPGPRLFTVSLSFHGGAICFNSVYNYTNTATPDEPIFFSSRSGGPTNPDCSYDNECAMPSPYGLAQAYYDGNTTPSFWYTNGADWYPTRGDTNDWSYYAWSTLDTTLEVTTAKWPDSSLIPTYTAQHVQAVVNYMLKSFQGISGTMTDATSGLPLAGQVVATCTASASPYVTVPHVYKEVFTDPTVGDFHRVLEPGTYTIECLAPGYQPSVTTGLVVTEDTTTVHNCALNCAPLTISNVQVSAVGPTSATITWTTNAAADSTVLFGTISPPTEELYDPATVTSHSMTLAGLNQCTGYYVSVISGTSGCLEVTDTNNGMYYTFVTRRDNSVFRDDMESGPDKWTAASPWSISTENAHSGTAAWSDSVAGSYANNLNISLSTIALDLSAETSSDLVFWHRYSFERDWDFGHVEVSANGSSWTELAQFTGPLTTWTEVVCNLDSYAGDPTVWIRFRITSDSSVVDDGWYIDDVSVGGQAASVCLPVSNVPDGTEDGTTQLQVEKAGALLITWDTATQNCAAPHYHLVWGWGAALDTYSPLDTDCSLTPSGTFLWEGSPDTSADYIWLLVVGNDGDMVEGSWGLDSQSVERRSEPSGACGTTILNNWPCEP